MPSRRELANAIRFLSVDAIQKAKSGHPGLPMGMADIAEVVWNDYLKHNPEDPSWWDRDRFVLSNGHGSMLLYSLLHLTGYDLSLDDLKAFRQWGSKTPGHPEHGVTPGVETTTGPLGQGLANAVGMALAEKLLAAEFNQNGFHVISHYTYAFAGDGCLMEGLSHEACSLAGALGLGKLIVFYDDNGISIDGQVRGWFNDDTAKRFEAYGWQVLSQVDGHNPDAVAKAINRAREDKNHPSLICCRTIIGYGAPNLQGTAKTHGAPLGEAEISETRKNLAWPSPPFEIPTDIAAAWNARAKGRAAQSAWNELYKAYVKAYPELARELERRMTSRLPEAWDQTARDYVLSLASKGQDLATRQSSQKAIAAFAPVLPEMLGGSADLTESNLTVWPEARPVNPSADRDMGGDYIYYGVREFGMGAIMNGLALHGGFIPFGGTFLVFSDYARNAIRMAALMGQRVIWVLTHDSIGLGEDGPTHQPVEHVASLRLIPGLSVWRPCDDVETAVAWRQAINDLKRPTALILSRQKLPHLTRSDQALETIERGGYVIKEPAGPATAIIMATGSEVSLALSAADLLTAKGLAVRVVSMPNLALFKAQDRTYQETVLPPAIKARVAVEAGVSEPWVGLVGDAGRVIGLNRFGESAPAGVLFEQFGFTPELVATTVEAVLSE